MRFIQSCLYALIILSGSSYADKIILTPEQAYQQLSQASLQAELEQLKTADYDQLAEMIQVLLQPGHQSVVQNEYLLYAITQHISQQPALPKYDALLKELMAYQSNVYWQLNDGGHAQHMLAYPIAGLATATQTHRRLNQSVDRLLATEQIDVGALENYLLTTDNLEAQAVFEQLIEQLAVDQKQRIATWSYEQPGRLTPVMLFTLAEQLADKSIYQRAVTQLMSSSVRRPTASVLAGKLSAMSTTLPQTETTDLLLQLTHSEHFGSLAIHQLSGLQSPKVKTRLFELLSNKKLGGDAAQMLSQALDQETVFKLEQALTSSDRIRSRRSLLVLKQSPHPMAKQIIDDYVAKHPGTQLAQEVSQ